VAITRAKKSLTVTHARQRMLYGRTTSNRLSRFIRDIPEELLDQKSRAALRPKAQPGPERMLYDDLPFAEPRSRAWGSGKGGAGGFPARGGLRRTAGGALAGLSGTAQAKLPDFQPGDSVSHTAFGRGMVLTVTKMGSDALLEIAFDEKGTKKLLAKTAAEHMKKL